MCSLYTFLSSFVHAPEYTYCTPICHVIQFCLYFTLAKDGVKHKCIYAHMFVPVVVFHKKIKKDLYTSMGKNQKLCHNCPTIYLLSWEGEGNPYVSNPVNTLKKRKKKKKLKSAPVDIKILTMHLFRLPVCW